MKKVRVALFADIHIRDNKIQSQTDFGAPSKWLPKRANLALKSIKPDYIFGLGDLTATGHKKDWLGYRKWIRGLNAPVFDLMGNHDRDYTVYHMYNYGQEYFTILGRVASSKAVKIANNIFILISEEHDPEGNKKMLTSTVPLKTFSFVEKILKKYFQDHNIFVLSHTLLRGTTALSNDWSFNDINDWNIISNRFFDLFEKYKVAAHLTGHTHIDYRYRAKLKDIGGRKYKHKVGKFINGEKFTHLPDTYFLNIPCIDTAHGWIGSNFALLRQLGKATAKAKRSPLRRMYISLEEKGPRVFDFLYQSRINNILGRPAVYYFDIIPGANEVNIITRWLRNNKDTESYKVILNNKIIFSNSKAQIVCSDLCIQYKENLNIMRDNWFQIPAEKKALGIFSQLFKNKKKIKNIKVIAEKKLDYSVLYKGSKDFGETWDKNWIRNPAQMGKLNAVKLKIRFQPNPAPVKVKNILII